MTRLEATRVIVELAGDAPIVASLGHPAYDLFAAGDRPQNFYTWGSMGLASSIGLGLALARPDVRVFVLDGDGSLLMNLGSLATIGLLRPANLVRRRDGQRGVRDDRRSADADGARRRSRGRRARDGDRRARRRCGRRTSCARARWRVRRPLVIVAKVKESAPTAKPPLDCVFIKQRFMAAIGNPESATEGAAL